MSGKLAAEITVGYEQPPGKALQHFSSTEKINYTKYT